MNELINSFKYIPYTLKNAMIEIIYNKKIYSIWLIINLIVISSVFLLLNLTSSLPIDKSTRVWQLSGYLLFFWISGALYFSVVMLKNRGFMLNVTNIPIYVLVCVQIINFFLMFLVSFIMLKLIIMTNHIEIETSWIGVIYFIILTILLLLPICTILALTGHLERGIKAVTLGLIFLIFLTVPIMWIPSNMPVLVSNILKLNPFYFIINGFQEAVLLGTSSFYNIPLHILFFFELMLIYLWFTYFYRTLKDEINVNKTYKDKEEVAS